MKEKGWKDFSPIQKAAFPSIYAGKDCLIEAPTAGGKTEAVFFPTLSRAALSKHKSVQILYIAPLRALLNDIELRVEKYSSECGLKAFKWHGDVDQKEKTENLLIPAQVLLTTPESLEAILLRKPQWSALFADLETIIIDEAHNFAAGDRGSHLLCLLARLESALPRPPQRIAVTATIGNRKEMLRWFSANKGRPEEEIRVQGEIRKDRDFTIHFFSASTEDDGPTASVQAARILFNLLPGKRSIVFAKSRSQSEELARIISNWNNETFNRNAVQVRTHHSAVSKYFREEAESRIKQKGESGLNAIISTSTLELGIDVGELHQVIQMGGLSSSSAFLQRVGRTGRREGKPQVFTGICSELDDLLLLTASVNLGLRGESEAILFPHKSYHILAHQLICLCLQNNGISPEKAWSILNGTSCLQDITKTDFQVLVLYMIQESYLRDADGDLVIGEKGEEKFLGSNWRRLFAVFETGPMYDIYEGKNHVGTLDQSFVQSLQDPFYFILGGIEWKAEKIIEKTRTIIAHRTKGAVAPRWESFGGMDVPFETAREMGRIMKGGDELPSFLNANAKTWVEAERVNYQKLPWSETQWPVQISDTEEVDIWTFAGDRINRTLAKVLASEGLGTCSSNFKRVHVKPGVSNGNGFGKSVFSFLENIFNASTDTMASMTDRVEMQLKAYPFSKFSSCLPDSLARKALGERLLDWNGLWREAKKTRSVIDLLYTL